MLKTLSIWNFVLIEHVEIEFDEGLNILTGETGAGKSILIDALGVVLGNRATSQYIRTGCADLKVEAVFSVDEEVKQMLNDMEIEVEDEIIITRKIAHNGKNAILINGIHVAVNMLKNIASKLVDVHGQNENLSLMKEESSYKLIENEETAIILREYQKLYRLWKSQQKHLEEKKKSAEDNEKKLEILKWQDEELTNADLKTGEEEELEEEFKMQANAEKISELVKGSCDLLNGEDERTVLSALSKVKESLNSLSRYDKALDSLIEIVNDAYINLQEVNREIHNYGERFEYSPQRLEELQKRMEQIKLLKKKYGATIEEIQERHKEIKTELNSIENFDVELEIQNKKIEKIKMQAKRRAIELMKERVKRAEIKTKAIEKEIKKLGMNKARFKIEVKEKEILTPNGTDEVEIKFSANIGEEMQPLIKVASGGELSRIALAMKTVEAERDKTAKTMIFDEIDSGIGGMTANAVAECIAKVSKNKQVLCITHLAQIACMADVHLSIKKTDDEIRSLTQVHKLLGMARTKEIARMASGRDATEASIKNANEMLKKAESTKRSIRR